MRNRAFVWLCYFVLLVLLLQFVSSAFAATAYCLENGVFSANPVRIGISIAEIFYLGYWLDNYRKGGDDKKLVNCLTVFFFVAAFCSQIAFAESNGMEKQLQNVYKHCFHDVTLYDDIPPMYEERRTEAEKKHTEACKQFVRCMDDTSGAWECSKLIEQWPKETPPVFVSELPTTTHYALNDFDDFLHLVKEALVGDFRLVMKLAVDFRTSDLAPNVKTIVEDRFYEPFYMPDGRKTTQLDYWAIAGDLLLLGTLDIRARENLPKKKNGCSAV